MTDKKKAKPIKLEWDGGLTTSINETPIEVKGKSDKPEKLSARKILGKADIRRESKGRAGKPVAIICKFSDEESKNIESLKLLCSELKNILACGGTVESNEIILTHRDFDKIKIALEKIGISARIV
ncbi:translation initiation factor [Fluviispira multicolorata]|uniref:SUI1 domain-containing protein n=1 Tax=Fluviispira multicolorata TaxID=2654512 RepID=A0A833JD00_9BACT|nr:translation initiation factor [Fluviispira multicolorata]KAB8031021.1 hypothetical protein GCL57_08620 [Fluviispira multicolorata]